MTGIDFIALMPLIILAAMSVVLLLVIAFARNYSLTAGLTLLAMAAAIGSLPLINAELPRSISPLLMIDTYGVYFVGLILAAGFVVTVLSYTYFNGYPDKIEEFYVLLITAVLGSCVMAVSNHFIAFFLGLEILSVSLYGLIAYPTRYRERIEAGLKYLVLAGATSSILLFGIALIYTVTGTMDFSQMSLSTAQTPTFQALLLIGWGMLLVGFGFKLSLVPFQLWSPDVYEGAPLPVTALIATISKGSVFAIMLRYFTQVPVNDIGPIWTIFAVMAIASMLYGNILALVQTNLKRILAYSSIAHLGYMLVAFLASGSLVKEVIAFYLAVYFVSSLVAFGVMALLSRYDGELQEVADYTGLFWKRRWLALLMAAAMLSLAGIPPFAGAIGKIFLAAAGVQSNLWLLLMVLVISSIIGAFYYIRVALTVFRKRPEEEAERVVKISPVQRGEYLVMAVLFLLLVGFGLYPTPLLGTISQLMAGLAR